LWYVKERLILLVINKRQNIFRTSFVSLDEHQQLTKYLAKVASVDLIDNKDVWAVRIFF
jgi:hypothetical protein